MTPSEIMALKEMFKTTSKDATVTPESWNRIEYAADVLVNTLDGIDTDNVTNGEAYGIAVLLGRTIEIANTLA